ncbi:hypothetical protein EKM01_11230 [Flavobacterium sp. RSP46]|uniref:hypothetical protein n=1 Tax=Flavobacterium sp. RSP46 TaxID=2497486 RepID=UPI000F88E91D|nr:hypothetical protein [Flavobacterium sp. RSP46]RTY90491.1 hypothetical protein EKM01_11230 [Flavobacterium sp. RSP46]
MFLLLFGLISISQSHAQDVDYRTKAKKLVAKMSLEEKLFYVPAKPISPQKLFNTGYSYYFYDGWTVWFA